MPLSPFQIVADISDTQDREDGEGEVERGRFKLEFCVSTSVSARGWFVRAIKSINGFACLPTFRPSRRDEIYFFHSTRDTWPSKFFHS